MSNVYPGIAPPHQPVPGMAPVPNHERISPEQQAWYNAVHPIRVTNPNTPNRQLMPPGHGGHVKIMWDYKEYELAAGESCVYPYDIAQKFLKDCPWVVLEQLAAEFASREVPKVRYTCEATGKEFNTQAELMAHIRDFALAQAAAAPPQPVRQPGAAPPKSAVRVAVPSE